MHDWPLIQWYDGFRSWWAIAQRTVWSLCVVVFPPFFNDDQRFPKAVEDLSVAQLISEPAVEARTVSIKIYINQLFTSEPTEVKVAIVNRH